MRSAVLSLMMVLLAGCASDVAALTSRDEVRQQVLEIANAPEVYSALPAQALDGGSCGIFLFHVREPHNFTLFEHEDQRLVKILHEGGIIETGVTAQDTSFIEGESFRRVYLADDESLTFTLTGSVGPESVTGQLLGDVVLRTREISGRETVQPLGGVRTCRGNAPTVWRQ